MYEKIIIFIEKYASKLNVWCWQQRVKILRRKQEDENRT